MTCGRSKGFSGYSGFSPPIKLTATIYGMWTQHSVYNLILVDILKNYKGKFENCFLSFYPENILVIYFILSQYAQYLSGHVFITSKPIYRVFFYLSISWFKKLKVIFKTLEIVFFYIMKRHITTKIPVSCYYPCVINMNWHTKL